MKKMIELLSLDFLLLELEESLIQKKIFDKIIIEDAGTTSEQVQSIFLDKNNYCNIS